MCIPLCVCVCEGACVPMCVSVCVPVCVPVCVRRCVCVCVCVLCTRAIMCVPTTGQAALSHLIVDADSVPPEHSGRYIGRLPSCGRLILCPISMYA